jgi:hypothetical protein
MAERLRDPDFRLLARSPTINFSLNIADTFWIHAPYRIWKLNVKSKSKKWDRGLKCLNFCFHRSSYDLLLEGIRLQYLYFLEDTFITDNIA